LRICNHHRYEDATSRRDTTFELIVAEGEWKPRTRKPRTSRSPEDMVYVRIGYAETEVRANMKALGAIWRSKARLWELPWGVARGLGLEDRVMEESRNGMGG